MKKLYLISALILSLSFTACSSYSVTKYFEKDDFYNRAVQYTKKANIADKESVSAMVNVTYLNSVDSKFNNEYENFIVGVYVVNEKKKNETLNITMNDKLPLVINLLDKKDKLNNLPLKNHWADYYLISFEKEKRKTLEKPEENLTIKYVHTTEESVSLTFLREL